MDRYVVDERVGCIAVIDSLIEHGNGLHRDDEHVIAYWHGVKIDSGMTGGWTIYEGDKISAHTLCNYLNSKDARLRLLETWWEEETEENARLRSSLNSAIFAFETRILKDSRNAALEEAARTCEDTHYIGYRKIFAEKIRSLKEE